MRQSKQLQMIQETAPHCGSLGCMLPQFATPAGPTCAAGHGGAPSVQRNGIYPAMPPVWTGTPEEAQAMGYGDVCLCGQGLDWDRYKCPKHWSPDNDDIPF